MAAPSSTPDDFLGGRVLIAMPGIGDPRFERAVILMCAHSADHAIGLTLNHPAGGLTVPELLEQLEISVGGAAADDEVLLGGPVDHERGFVLHTDDYLCADVSVQVCNGVALTATLDALKAMDDPIRRPRRSVLALGYAGWGAGQLEREIQQSAWLTCDADETLMFGIDHETKWAYALAKIGVSPAMLSAHGGNA